MFEMISFVLKLMPFLFNSFRCRGKSSCNVTVSSELLGDACHGTPKYLEVQYYCEDGKFMERK